MRFKRRPPNEYVVTDRKRAAAARKQRCEQEALPLLAEMIAAEQPSIETVMDERVRRWIETEQAWRDRRAGQWRRARRDLEALPDDLRAPVLRYWNDHRWLPGDPGYLLDALHRLSNGALQLINGRIEPARVTISTSEMEGAQLTRKPIAAGWLARRR